MLLGWSSKAFYFGHFIYISGLDRERCFFNMHLLNENNINNDNNNGLLSKINGYNQKMPESDTEGQANVKRGSKTEH